MDARSVPCRSEHNGSWLPPAGGQRGRIWLIRTEKIRAAPRRASGGEGGWLPGVWPREFRRVWLMILASAAGWN